MSLTVLATFILLGYSFDNKTFREEAGKVFQKQFSKPLLDSVFNRVNEAHYAGDSRGSNIHSNEAEPPLNDTLLRFLAKVQTILVDIDPLNIQHAPVNIDTNLLRFQGYLDSMSFSGFSQFSVDKLNASFEDQTLTLGLGYESILATGKYDLTFDLLRLLAIYGCGDFGLVLSDIKISFHLWYGERDDGTLSIISVSTDYKISMFQADVGGLMGSGPVSELISRMMTDVVAPMLMDHRGVITKLMDSILLDTLNHATKRLTLQDILNIIHRILS